MVIGVIVDGNAESSALRELIAKLDGADPIRGPYYANMQPLAPPPTIARSAMKAIRVAKARGATRILILIDRENNDACPPGIADTLAKAFSKLGEKVDVVIKNRKFENWLIADPDALAGQRRRFTVSNASRRSVCPNKADHIHDAEKLLNHCAIRIAYHKRIDATSICRNSDLTQAAANSRSLRKFLRSVGDARYKNQSKNP